MLAVAVLSPMEGLTRSQGGKCFDMGWRVTSEPVKVLGWGRMLRRVLCCSPPEMTAGGSSTP